MTLSLPRFAATAAATLVALCAAGAWPTERAAGAGGLVAMAWAAAISFVAAIVGYLPTAFAKERTAARLQAAMVGVGVRLLVTLVAVLVLLAGAISERVAFVAWIGIDYAVLLLLETLVVLRGARTVESASA